jgi:hypothetical protein
MHLLTLADYAFDGNAALSDVVGASPYKSSAQVVASLTAFSDPAVVAETGARNLFRIVRVRRGARRHQIQDYRDGGRVLLDDNSAPTDAFLWSHGIRRGRCRDVQFNHIGESADDVEHYTSLANICATPSFLAKLTDTDQEIVELIRYRAWLLYKDCRSVEPPKKPIAYDALTWARPLEAPPDLETRLTNGLPRKRKCSAAISAREIGWYYSGFAPDRT